MGKRLRDNYATKPHNADGSRMSQWIVVDYYDVLVHIFHTEKRAFYSLEDLWSDAPRPEVAEGDGEVRGLSRAFRGDGKCKPIRLLVCRRHPRRTIALLT